LQLQDIAFSWTIIDRVFAGLRTWLPSAPGFAPKRFKLSLDRSGAELEDIIAAVDAAQESILDLDDQPDFTGYIPGKFHTAFRYELADKTGKRVASAGLADLDTCLPYTLAFVPELESVEYPNRKLSLEKAERKEDEVQILSVTAADPLAFFPDIAFSYSPDKLAGWLVPADTAVHAPDHGNTK
jgi:hypothetical protein